MTLYLYNLIAYFRYNKIIVYTEFNVYLSIKLNRPLASYKKRKVTLKCLFTPTLRAIKKLETLSLFQCKIELCSCVTSHVIWYERVSR